MKTTGNIEQKILVTGATGFLGYNLIEELVISDYKVKGFVQNGIDDSNLRKLEIEIAHGNIENYEHVKKAVYGCDIVIHTAALIAIYPARSKNQWTVNYFGTQNIIRASKHHGIKQFLHIGSASSFGFGSRTHLRNETSEYNGSKFKLDYIDSKKAAVDYVISEYKNNRFPSIVLTPTFMLGANGTKLGSNSIILSVIRNSLPGFTSGGKNFIYVKDVVRGIINALTKGKIGESYILGNENLSYREILKKIASVTNSQCPKYKLPIFIVKLYGLFSSVIGLIMKKPPQISYTMSKLSNVEQYYSSLKAIKELELPQTSIEIAIKEAYEYFKKTNVI